MAGHLVEGRARSTAIAIGACALALVTLRAQSPPAQPPAQPPATQNPPAPQDPQRPPPIRTGAELVRVDATVIDRRGYPVHELTAEDFEIQEDNVPQEISSFKFVSVNGHPTQGDELSLPIRSREHAAAEASRDDVRVFLIFWDEYHINRLTSALHSREYLMKFVRSAFGPTDLVAFMDPLTPTEAIRFTRDRLELAERVRTLQGRSGIYSPVRSVLEEAHMYAREGVERIRSQVTLSALKAAAVHLGTVRQGRKAIILISEGMRGLGRDEPSMISDLIQAANDSNTGIYTLNPLGLTMTRSGRFDMLQALSTETGAESFTTNDFDRALRRVVVQSSAYYLLGYMPGQRALDGKFHRIKVRVKRSGLEVRARAGYWAPTVRDMNRATKEKAEVSSLPPAVTQALSELTPAAARRTVDLWIGTGLGPEGRPQVRIVWTPREPETGEAAEAITGASAVATSPSGRAFDGEVTPQGVTFEAPPGQLQVALAARNAAGELIDRHSRTITVPDPATDLWISSPAIIRTSNSLELRNARNDPAATPSASREFARNERLLIRFAVHGNESAGATVTVRLLNGRGGFLTNLTLIRRPDAAETEIDLPLTSVARGDYLISIQANQGVKLAEVVLPMRVVR
jgi:VWFA-related protein